MPIRILPPQLIYPSEWDISIRCDYDTGKCKMVYVERLSRRDVERRGLNFDEVVEATKKFIDLIAEVYGSGAHPEPEMKLDMRVEDDTFVAKVEMEAPLPIIATVIVGEFVGGSLYADMTVADALIGSMLTKQQQRTTRPRRLLAPTLPRRACCWI